MTPVGDRGPKSLMEADAADSLRLARQHLAPGLAFAQKITGRGAVEWTATGAQVRLSDGREVIDFGSYAVTLIGHRHPSVVAAVQRQLDLMPTSSRTLCNPTTVRLASRLAALADPGRLERVWFGLNGCDVVELAFKLARVATRKRRILAVRRGFHGKSLGALAATWSPRYRTGSEDMLSGVTHLDPDDSAAVRREVSRDDVAAVVFEPIQGEGGVWPLRPEVLRQWATDARAAGAFVLSDEIQAGLGRCGPFSVAVAMGVAPDAVLLGKSLGGGVMPLSAIVATADLYAPLVRDPFLHSSTFSGHPLSCAAGLATLDVVQALAERADEFARRIELALAELRRRHADIVLDVRGQGLMWGVELAPLAAGRVLLEIGRMGLLLAPCLDRPEVLRLVPPMVTTDLQFDRAVETLDEACRLAEDFR